MGACLSWSPSKLKSISRTTEHYTSLLWAENAPRANRKSQKPNGSQHPTNASLCWSRENTYLSRGEGRLHNIILTTECVPASNAKKLLQVLTTGKEAYTMFREERYISCSTPLSAVIHKQKLPTFQSATDMYYQISKYCQRIITSSKECWHC